jgi:hypothetical protein
MKQINDLESKLLKAKKESDRFFTSFSNVKLSKTVLLKLRKCNNETGRKRFTLPKIRIYYGLAARIALISVCFLLLVSIGLFLREKAFFENEKEELLGKPVSQQKISLNNIKEQWLHFFKINKPGKVQDNLLAVIWETGGNGEYEMAYSSLFENSSKPGPVGIVSFNNNQPPIMIISTKNVDKHYIHYRIIGYLDTGITALMEQNYVTGGEIEVIDGVIKETRLVPGAYLNKELSGGLYKMVTYYIAYQSNELGDILTPVDSLRISKGDYIAIMGKDNTPVEASNTNLITDLDINNEVYDQKLYVKFFEAESPGHEDIHIKPVKAGGQSKTIAVEVIDNNTD